MKPEEYYNNRLQQVVSHIRVNYHKRIFVKELEELSNFSYRNLHRIFKAIHGETIGAYVTRIKVENGARKLLFSTEEIKIIAEKVGYSDVQVFSKSFKKHFGISPAKYRNNKEEILVNNTNLKYINVPFYEDRIEVLKPFKVMFKTFKGNYYDVAIETVWQKLFEEFSEANLNLKKTQSLGIIWDEPILSESILYNYDACFVINNDMKIPDRKFKVKTIPTQKYAVFIHIGDYHSISKTYDKIFGSWLLNSNMELSEKPFLEFYTKNESHVDDPNKYETEIYVPLKD